MHLIGRYQKGSIGEGYKNLLRDKVIDRVNNNTLKGKKRWMVQDICDSCLTNCYIKRSMLKMRRYGWRFMCPACSWKRREGGNPVKCKEEKIFLAVFRKQDMEMTTGFIKPYEKNQEANSP